MTLASNENPLGAGRDAQTAASRAALGLYPDASMKQLRLRLSELHGVTDAEVCVGAGSTDLIFHLVAALATGGEVLALKHTFIAYRLAARSCGATYVEHGEGPRGDLESLAAQVTEKTRLLCVVNPANPTGQFFEPRALHALLERVPSSLPVIVDEAYAEYVRSPRVVSGSVLRRGFPNVLVLRTFSKAYGLAGLRVGYAVGKPEWLEQVERRRPPFSVSGPAQAAACAALDDVAHLQASVMLAQSQRQAVFTALQTLGLEVLPSEGNFVCVRLQDVPRAVDCLHQEGVAVLRLDVYGLPDWLRITIGDAQQNARMLSAIERASRAVAGPFMETFEGSLRAQPRD